MKTWSGTSSLQGEHVIQEYITVHVTKGCDEDQIGYHSEDRSKATSESGLRSHRNIKPIHQLSRHGICHVTARSKYGKNKC